MIVVCACVRECVRAQSFNHNYINCNFIDIFIGNDYLFFMQFYCIDHNTIPTSTYFSNFYVLIKCYRLKKNKQY